MSKGGVGALIALLWVAFTAPAAADPVPSVVSVDYCADQYVLALADRRQIAGVSARATREFSFYRDRAEGLPVVAATAEGVLDRAPDLVVRFWGGNRRMVAMLERVGIAAVNVTYGIDDTTIAGNLRAVGAALGQPDVAAAHIAERTARISALKQSGPLGLRALYLTPSGTTGGAGTDVDAMLSLAGLENLAVDLGYAGWRTVSLEALIRSPPDLFIGSFFDDSAVARSSWSVARHGRLADLMERIPTIAVPGRYLSCSGLFSVQAAEYIRGALADMNVGAAAG